MGALASTPIPELPDLLIDVDLEEGAQIPCYPSTGRGGMVLVSNRDVCVRAHEEVAVCTGVAFHMPYMLVGMITDAGNIMHVDVRTDMYDYDDARDFLNVRLIYRPPPSLAESKPMLHISRGDPLAYLTILPIGRPGLRTVRLAGPENEEEEEGRGGGGRRGGAPRAHAARRGAADAQDPHRASTGAGVRCGGGAGASAALTSLACAKAILFTKKNTTLVTRHTTRPASPQVVAPRYATVRASARLRR